MNNGKRTRRAIVHRPGFTLVELLAVMTIIGILLALILAASLDADKQARIQATQALIQKLESALNDRFDALMQSTPNPNWAHGYLAAVYSSAAQSPQNPLGMLPPVALASTGNDNPTIKTTLRAQVFATYDYIKSELPDTFFVNAGFPNSIKYPFNFAAIPYAGTAIDTNSLGNFMLPLGHMVQGPLIAPTTAGGAGGFGDSFVPTQGPYAGILQSSNPTLGFTGSGIFGASYTAAAGLYKNLGYLATGYDAVDNNGNGLIDESDEGLDATNSALVAARLLNHTHNTARAEMLYALLVEGSGPWGAAFSPDEFSDKEVQDTDGDGMPEFVDGWGHPLQFFRWPILYHSDFEHGQTITATSARSWGFGYPYQDLGSLDQREQDTLDPNQQLTAPGWWSSMGVGGLAANNNYPQLVPVPPAQALPNESLGALAFGALFHTLSEPMIVQNANNNGFLWDRGGSFRRAFYSKFLILSAGPDGMPGVFLYPDGVLQSATPLAAAQGLIANENSAMRFGLDLVDFTASLAIPAGATIVQTAASGNLVNPTSYDIQIAGQDDITNHTVQSAGGLGGPGS